jgi:hypothetical protein
MGNAVAVAAFGKFFVYLGIMRLAVTVLALRYLAVLGMTFGATES